jgi:hypothetical protein
MTAFGEEKIAPKCAGTRKDGLACNIEPELLHQDDDGVWWCWNHDPDPVLAAERETARTRGGAATARKFRHHRYLDKADLGALESPADAMRWSAAIALGVATGVMSATAGNAALKAVEAFLGSLESVHLEERLQELEAQVARTIAATKGVR